MTGWRVLSLQQPYADAVLYLGKRIENRRQAWRYRGPVLLHASAGFGTAVEFTAACERIREVVGPPAWEAFFQPRIRIVSRRGEQAFVPLPGGPMVLGAIVGRAVIDGAIWRGAESAAAAALANGAITETDLRWWWRDQHGYVLRDAKAFEQPLPWAGGLGLRHAPSSLLEDLGLGGAR